jgi:hypothetical protein
VTIVVDLREAGYAPRGSDLYKALVDRQTVTTSCANCPWETSGTLADTRTAFEAHRQAAHPEIDPIMPSPRALALSKGELRPKYLLRDHGYEVAAA